MTHFMSERDHRQDARYTYHKRCMPQQAVSTVSVSSSFDLLIISQAFASSLIFLISLLLPIIIVPCAR